MYILTLHSNLIGPTISFVVKTLYCLPQVRTNLRTLCKSPYDRTIGHPNSVNTTCFKVLFLFYLAINFLHACGMNMSIAIARNAWIGNFVCLCVMENRSCVEQWMVEGMTALKKGLHN